MAISARKQSHLTLKIIFCMLANFVAFGICYYSGLPMRLEHIGSFYAAAAIGFLPAAGIAVVCQLVFGLFYFGFSNVVMVIPVLVVLWLIALAADYGWVETVISSLGTMALACFISAIGVSLLSLVIGREAFLEQTVWFAVYDILGNAGFDKWGATVLTVVPFAIFNTMLTWILALLCYRFTPKQITLGFSEHRNYKKGLQNRK